MREVCKFVLFCLVIISKNDQYSFEKLPVHLPVRSLLVDLKVAPSVALLVTLSETMLVPLSLAL